MSHLEDLWNQLGGSRAPLEAIIAAGAIPDTARTGRRSLIAATATIAAGAVVATTLAGVTVNSAHVPNTPIELSAFEADIKPASSCDALLQAYKQRAMSQVTEYGWKGGYYGGGYYGGYYGKGVYLSAARNFSSMDRAAMPQADALHGLAATALGALPNGAQAPKLLTQANSATGTNVQEIGVDEPDSVKTNGTMVARLNGSTLTVFDASGETIKPRGTLGLPYFGGGSILISGSTVIASGGNSDPAATNGGTRVDIISIADPDHPSITSSVVYAGANITAQRQQGNVVRMVLNNGLPQLSFVYPQKGKRTKDQALAINKHLIAVSKFKDWIPTYDAGTSEGVKQLLPCANVAIPPAGVPLGTTSVVSIDVTDPTTLHAIGVAGTLNNAYESQHNLYLTIGGNTGGCWAMFCPAYSGWGTNLPATTILQFKLDGVRTTHVATGQVQGVIANSWSMDEWAGILRVVTTRFGPQPKPITHWQGTYSWQEYPQRSHVNVVETLVPHNTTLVRQGQLTGLGQNQTLTAARWFDKVAIISTANNVDPLYMIDLSDTSHPKELGALHLPGQTQYIHPIASNRFLTISSQTTPDHKQYSQIAIFDTTDLKNVKQVDQVSAGQNTYSMAAQDPMNFTWLPDRQTALTPFNAPKGPFLGAYTVSGDRTLTQTSFPLTGSYSGSRTFEVANGRVVLVFGGSVSFLTM